MVEFYIGWTPPLSIDKHNVWWYPYRAKQIEPLSACGGGNSPRGRIENRVEIPDGTATVSVEALCKAKAGHWRNPRRPHRAEDSQVRRTAQKGVIPKLQVRLLVFFVAGKRLQHPYGCCSFFVVTAAWGNPPLHGTDGGHTPHFM